MIQKAKSSKQFQNKILEKKLIKWSLVILSIKVLIILNIKQANINLPTGHQILVGGIWPGADAENYITAFLSLSNEGWLSNDRLLHYWPAGYPFLLLVLSEISKGLMFYVLSLSQSLVFAFSTYLFAVQISKTRLKKYSLLIFICILINPTLTLSTITIGYENIVASGILLILALLIQDLVQNSNRIFIRNCILSIGVVSVISFFQPRFIFSGIIGLAIWIFFRKPLKTASILIILVFIFASVSPAILIFRNKKANNFYAISTNLGVTMNLGAGNQADGSFDPKGKYGVPCPTIAGDAAVQDRHLVQCVVRWYQQHPLKSVKLLSNKFFYFWSPWSGPLGSGSMGRNPWNKINPIKDIALNSQEGNKLVNGTVGKIVSWSWLLGSLLLLLIGSWKLLIIKGIEGVIGIFAISQVFISCLISMGTIGDHRQRLPILGLSIFLQVVGIKTIFKGKSGGLVQGPTLPPKVATTTIPN